MHFIRNKNTKHNGNNSRSFHEHVINDLVLSFNGVDNQVVHEEYLVTLLYEGILLLRCHFVRNLVHGSPELCLQLSDVHIGEICQFVLVCFCCVLWKRN